MPRNRRIKKLMEEIRRRGGRVGISEECSNEEAEFFLREVLDCPDCLEEARQAGRFPASQRSLDH